eukprot:tig00021348_g20514.t1
MRREALALLALLALAAIANAGSRSSDDADDDDEIIKASDRNKSKMRAFYAWLRENGVNSSLVRVTKLGRYGRGLQLRRGSVGRAEKLLEVPGKLWITCKKGDPLREALPLVRDPDWWCLALRLLIERANASSFWAPWIAVLPKQTFLPWDIAERDLAFYQSDDVRLLNRESKEELLKVYNHISKHEAVPASAVTHEGLKWAAAMAASRRLPGLGIVPLLDFANHSPREGREVTIKGGRAVMRAGADAVAGDQLFISYGDFDGRKLFLRYGFNIDVSEDHIDFKLPYNNSAVKWIKKWSEAALKAYDIEPEFDDGKTEFGVSDTDVDEQERVSFRMDFWNRQNAALAYFRSLVLTKDEADELKEGKKKITQPRFPSTLWDDLRWLNKKIPEGQRRGHRMAVGFKLLLWRSADLLLPSQDEISESERARAGGSPGGIGLETADGRKLDVPLEELEAMQETFIVPPPASSGPGPEGKDEL